MKHLYYTRHGESVVNINGVWATQVGTKLDRGLTKVGRKQAIKAGKEAAREGLCVDVMLVSPLMRAQETAEILADILGCKNLETLELLTERNFGSLEGTELADFFAEHAYQDLDEIEAAESIEALQARAEKALGIIKSRPEEQVLVVSHAAFGRALRRAIEGLPFDAEYVGDRIEIPRRIIQLLP